MSYDNHPFPIGEIPIGYESSLVVDKSIPGGLLSYLKDQFVFRCAEELKLSLPDTAPHLADQLLREIPTEKTTWGLRKFVLTVLTPEIGETVDAIFVLSSSISDPIRVRRVLYSGPVQYSTRLNDGELSTREFRPTGIDLSTGAYVFREGECK